MRARSTSTFGAFCDAAMNRRQVVFVTLCAVSIGACGCASTEPPLPPHSGAPGPQLSKPVTAEQLAFPAIQWSPDPTQQDISPDPELKRAWAIFEKTTGYVLARPQDRTFSRAALSRLAGSSPGRIVPAIVWWGLTGFESAGPRDSLVAIVVDPMRTDLNRYGLVVIAAPKGDGGRYRTFWVVRESDLGAWAFSPASGSVFVEAYREDGTSEIRDLVWDDRGREFVLR